MKIVVLLKSRMEETEPCDPKRYVEKKHLCSLCGYRTISSWNLKRHYQACRKKYEKYNLNHREEPIEARTREERVVPTRTIEAPALTRAPKRFREESSAPTRAPKRFREERVESVFLGSDPNNPIGSPIDCRIIENFKMYISGPSRCGKSIFITSLLQNRKIFMKKCPEVICFVFSVYQEEIYDQLRYGIVDYFIEDDDQLERNIQRIVEENKGKSTLIIYDDLINSNNLSFIAKQFTVTGRHSGISQVFVSQKLFPKDENIRLISNNSDYLVIFKNPRNATEIRILSNQMSKNVLSKIFHEATLEPYSYLFIDLTQECIPQKRYLSHLFNSDIYIHTYIEN